MVRQRVSRAKMSMLGPLLIVFRVQITDASGNVVTGPNGPFYLWDGCEACTGDGHMDLSGEQSAFSFYHQSSLEILSR